MMRDLDRDHRKDQELGSVLEEEPEEGSELPTPTPDARDAKDNSGKPSEDEVDLVAVTVRDEEPSEEEQDGVIQLGEIADTTPPSADEPSIASQDEGDSAAEPPSSPDSEDTPETRDDDSTPPDVDERAESEDREGDKEGSDDPEQDASVAQRVDLDEVTAGQIEIVGSKVENIFDQLSGDDRDGFLRVACEEWIRLHRLFVPSKSCESFAKQEFDRRLLVVVGKDHAGKRAMALHLASKLDYLSSEHSEVVIYRPAANHRQISLHDLLVRRDSPEKSLFLVEDVFELGISPIEIKSLDSLESQLRDRDSFLILTTELSEQDLPKDVARLAYSAQLGSEELFLLLERFLSRGDFADALTSSSQLRSRLRAHWQSLSSTLDAPFKIERFCQRLADKAADDEEILENDVLVLAQQAADPGPWLLSRWFLELGPNERLLAFLSVFFSDLQRPDLVSLYRWCAEWLRESNPALVEDPRTIGLESMLKAIQATTRNGFVQVEGSHFHREIVNQARNYELLLRSLTETLIARLGEMRSRDEWPLRKGLGTLVGFLGVEDWLWLEGILDQLAGHAAWQLRTVASYALDPIVALDLELRSSRSLDVLKEWADEASLNHRWTAGAAIWQVYRQLAERSTLRNHSHAQAMKDRLLNLLRQLMSESHWRLSMAAEATAEAKRLGATAVQDVATLRWKLLYHWRCDCSLFPLRHIVMADSVGVAPTMAAWMTRGSDFRNLSIDALGLALKSFARRHIAALPVLLAGLLDAASATNKRSIQVFEVLGQWLSRPNLRDDLLRALLELTHRTDGRQRRRLALLLADSWCRSQLEYERAGRLVTRLLALDGFGRFPPSPPRALLVWDPAELGKPNYNRVRRLMQHVLASCFELWINVLGDADSVCLEDAVRWLDDPGVAAARHRPRLLMPMLENPKGWVPDLVYVLADTPILDLDDLSLSSCEAGIVLFDLGHLVPEERDFPPGVRVETLPSLDSERVSGRVLQILQASQSWWLGCGILSSPEVFAPWGGARPDASWKTVEAALAGAAGETFAFPDENGRDPLGILAFSLANRFMSRTGEIESLLLRWLDGAQSLDGEPTTERQRVWVAAAAIKVLARNAVGVFDREGPSVARRIVDPLLTGLLDADPASQELIVALLEDWLELPAWWDCLSTDTLEEEARLPALLDRLSGAFVERAERLIGRRGTGQESAGRGWNALPPGLPPLEFDQTYGLIFLDRADRPDVAKLAFQIVAQLEAQPDSGEASKLALWDLGTPSPFWTTGVRGRKGPAQPADRPRLLLPSLERCTSLIPRVDFVLVVTTAPILDRSELDSTPWVGAVRFSAETQAARRKTASTRQLAQRLVELVR